MIQDSSSPDDEAGRMATHVVKCACLEGGMRVGRLLTPYLCMKKIDDLNSKINWFLRFHCIGI